MNRLIRIVQIALLLLFTVSCGSSDDTEIYSAYKNIWYAFDMVEEAESLKGLEAELEFYVGQTLTETYMYKGFGRWDTTLYLVPNGVIPVLKASIRQPEDVVYSEEDFPAKINFRMGIINGIGIDDLLYKEFEEEFENLSQYQKYMESVKNRSYIIAPNLSIN